MALLLYLILYVLGGVIFLWRLIATSQPDPWVLPSDKEKTPSAKDSSRHSKS